VFLLFLLLLLLRLGEWRGTSSACIFCFYLKYLCGFILRSMKELWNFRNPISLKSLCAMHKMGEWFSNVKPESLSWVLCPKSYPFLVFTNPNFFPTNSHNSNFSPFSSASLSLPINISNSSCSISLGACCYYLMSKQTRFLTFEFWTTMTEDSLR